MAVVTAFSAAPEIGLTPPSHTVVFTDESLGSPDRWLWDFGDGNFSYDQHPTHVFEGNNGDVFTVTLTAWIFDTKTTQSGSYARQTKTIQAITTFDQFYASSWSGISGSITSVYFLHKKVSDTVDFFSARRIKYTFNPAQESPPVIYVVEAIYNDNPGLAIDVFGGGLEISRESDNTIYGSPEDVSDLATATPLANITDEGSDTYIFQLKNLDAVGAISKVAGFGADVTIEKFTVSSADDIDTTSLVVAFGLPPVVAFDALPTVGPNPLTVQFENLSTPAIGLPTTYSWKKRKTGSGDSFVEFSTAENPSHIFTK